MQENNTVRVYTALALGVALLCVFVYWFIFHPQQTPTTPLVQDEVAVDISSISTTTDVGGYTITPVIEPVLSVPNYTQAIAYDDPIPLNVRNAIESQFAEVSGILAKDPKDFNAWARLGVLHKMAGDYNSAKMLWEYVSRTWPKNTVSFTNLGDLYTNYLKEYPKAETNYLAQIENMPNDTNAYSNLFLLYSTVYKTNTNAAEEILKKGIVANPKAYDLQVMLARYYKEHGRTAEAASMFEAAAKNAETAGQKDIAAQIRAEATQ